jgi:hypothetical protein
MADESNQDEVQISSPMDLICSRPQGHIAGAERGSVMAHSQRGCHWPQNDPVPSV